MMLIFILCFPALLVFAAGMLFAAISWLDRIGGDSYDG